MSINDPQNQFARSICEQIIRAGWMQMITVIVRCYYSRSWIIRLLFNNFRRPIQTPTIPTSNYKAVLQISRSLMELSFLWYYTSAKEKRGNYINMATIFLRLHSTTEGYCRCSSTFMHQSTGPWKSICIVYIIRHLTYKETSRRKLRITRSSPDALDCPAELRKIDNQNNSSWSLWRTIGAPPHDSTTKCVLNLIFGGVRSKTLTKIRKYCR